MLIISNKQKSKFLGEGFGGRKNNPRWVITRELAFTYDSIESALDGDIKLRPFTENIETYILDYDTFEIIHPKKL